jgi:hypothetical protein
LPGRKGNASLGTNILQVHFLRVGD